MSFIAIDLTLFVLFTLVTIIFLYRNKKNITRQGLLILYKTRIGIKIIDYVSKKYSKIIKPMQYVVIATGYALMVSILYYLIRFSIVYLKSATLAKAIKVPVLLPLFPYVPSLFKIDFLPPFYFTSWIIIIAVVAIPHEFFHGIFAKFSKIKVHSTGFGFLGPLIAFFVEPDEKTMNKAPKKDQMAILAAGTFANVLVTILFIFVMWGFFALAFAPAGVNFNTYSFSQINNSNISLAGNVSFGSNNYLEIIQDNKTYFTSLNVEPLINNQSLESIIVYDDTPAFNSQIEGAITSIDNVPIRSYENLSKIMKNYGPGDKITLKTINDNKINEYQITLAGRNGNSFLGIGWLPSSPSGLIGKVYTIVGKIKSPEIYYQSKLGDFGIFISDLLWWLIIINISVALMNMLPLGIFDGGRFFYLTILGITRKKKIAEWAFKISTWILLLLVIALMLKWAFAIF